MDGSGAHDAPDGGGTAASSSEGRPKKKGKAAPTPDDPLHRAGFGEEFEVTVDGLDQAEYSAPSVTIRMKRNAATGFPECLGDGCPNRHWCNSTSQCSIGWCVKHVKAKSNNHLPPLRAKRKLQGGGFVNVAGTCMTSFFQKRARPSSSDSAATNATATAPAAEAADMAAEPSAAEAAPEPPTEAGAAGISRTEVAVNDELTEIGVNDEPCVEAGGEPSDAAAAADSEATAPVASGGGTQ